MAAAGGLSVRVQARYRLEKLSSRFCSDGWDQTLTVGPTHQREGLSEHSDTDHVFLLLGASVLLNTALMSLRHERCLVRDDHSPAERVVTTLLAYAREDAGGD